METSQESSSPPQRRRFKRVPVEVKVLYKLDDDTKGDTEAISTNVSEGGICLKTMTALPKGKTISLKFTLPGSRLTLAKGKIIKTNLRGQGINNEDRRVSP